MLRHHLAVSLAALLVIGLTLVGCTPTPAQPIGREPPGIPDPKSTKELPPQSFERIPPGTVIGDKPPEGWTHIVSVAEPRLGKGDVNKAPREAVTFTNMFWPVILASVKKEAASFTLDKVAIGYALPINGRRVVASSTDRQGAKLGLFGPQVLKENEKFLDESREVAWTATMQVYDIPGVFLRGDEHKPMWMRHAVLVNPKTGQLASVVWLLEKEGDAAYPLAEETVQLLPPNSHEDRVLNVKGDKITFGIPSADAFAQVQIPQGKALKVTPALKKVAGMTKFTGQTAAELEVVLRELIGDKWPQ